MSETPLVVARVRGVHGVRGRVRVELLTDRPEDRFRIGTVLRPEGELDTLTIVEARAVPDGPGWWLRFREVGDRTAADGLRDRYLVADVPADELAEGEVYWHELIGVEVVDRSGARLGTIEDVYRAGETEVIVIDGGPHGYVDVPLVGAFVADFRPREGRVVIDVAALDLPDPDARPRPRGRRTRRALRATEAPRSVLPATDREPASS